MRICAPMIAASMAAALVSCTHATGRRQEATPRSGTSAQASQAGSRAPISRHMGYATASDGVRIYYEACGSGPAIVFVHGLGGNHAVWFQQVAHFATDHTVVTLSQRGFAPSGGDQSHYDVKLLVRDLEAVMTAAGVERAVVVGQSMGGWTALGLALASPQRVSALVLADTLGGIYDEEIGTHMKTVSAEAARLQSSPPPLATHPALGAGFSRERPDLAYLYQTLATFGSPAPDQIVGQLGRARVSPAMLEEMKVPTLFIVGSEDRLFPPALVEKASAYVHGSQVRVIEQAGHSPYFERPEAWNSELASFLAKH